MAGLVAALFARLIIQHSRLDELTTNWPGVKDIVSEIQISIPAWNAIETAPSAEVLPK